MIFTVILLTGCKQEPISSQSEKTDNQIDFYDVANMDSIYELIYMGQPVLVGIAKDLGDELLYVSNFICDLKPNPKGAYEATYDSLFVKIWKAEKINDKPLFSPKYVNDLLYKFWIACRPIWGKLNIDKNDTIFISLYDFWGVGNNHQFMTLTNGKQTFLACYPSLIRYVDNNTYLSQYVTINDREKMQLIDFWDRDSLINSDKRFRLEHEGEIGGGGLHIMSARISFRHDKVIIDTISYNSFKSSIPFIKYFDGSLND